ncbi:hypothetical protein OVA24_07910 [Luteolibacter sp. SL250]|uniref:hypothetical protein n=1 Tax=Luteolibacter sp. SL250 TaxID=2995170 RepID=UPI00226F7E41|nr:hypothetical protein [Luteolibacter sp. SL250]WAC21308.1 hypothetical protein OVA24_07910 [Luteolibacter sp. SL250]
MKHLSLMIAKSSLVYLTVVSVLGYIFPVAKITVTRGVLDAFLLLAVVGIFMSKPAVRITAAVAGVVNAAGFVYEFDPFLRVALSGVGSITILIGPWSIPGPPGVLLAVIPFVLSFVSCIFVIFYAERELGDSGAAG